MTGKLVPCIKIDDIPGEMLFVVTANKFDSRQPALSETLVGIVATLR